MNPSSLSGFVTTFFRILGSTVVGKHSAVLVGGEGGVGDEQITDAEAYGAPGIVFRPRTPETIDGEELYAEAFGVRTPGGGIPLAWRDLRFNRRFPNPKPGTVALVGYGGGFLSFDDADGDTSLATMYVPYARDGAGVTTKAHMLSMGLDGAGKPLVGLFNGEGPRLTLLEETGVLASKTGASRVEVNDDDGVTVAGALKAASGADLGGPTSQALAKYAALAAWATAVDAWIAIASPLLNVTGPAAGAAGALAAPAAAIVTTGGVVTVPATGGTLFVKGA